MRVALLAVVLVAAAAGCAEQARTPTAIAVSTTVTTPPTTTAAPTAATPQTATPTTRHTTPTTRRATPTTAAPARSCDPAYPGVCLHDGISDYDCAGGSGNGPNHARGPIQVLPPDPFRLDTDHDGTGCES